VNFHPATGLKVFCRVDRKELLDGGPEHA